MIAYNTDSGVVWRVVGCRLFKSDYDLNNFALKELEISSVLLNRANYSITTLLHGIIT